jgi:hypothetical protein
MKLRVHLSLRHEPVHARRDLGLTFRDARDSVTASAAHIIKYGLV